MKKSKFSESKIVAILREGEAGIAVAELVRLRTYRSEVLDQYLFESILHVQSLTEKWLSIYNCEWPP